MSLYGGRIIRHLVEENWMKKLMMPNFTPGSWWECDVDELTAAGYFVEYEVKTSRNDFFADRNKSKPYTHNGVTTSRTKHELLAAGSHFGPCRFSFVSPVGLLTPNDIPTWAGWIEATEVKHGVTSRVKKAAPQLHREKAPPGHRMMALDSCYYRFHRAARFDGQEFEEGTGI